MGIDRIVEGRRTAYASCAARYSAAATQDSIYGDDCSCQNNARATAYWWAQDVMTRYPINGEDCGCQCVTEEFACEVIKMMDPSCVECACGDRPATCDVAQDYTVYQALDADQQGVIANVAGRATLILSNDFGSVNDWSGHVGEIAIDDGAGVFTYITPPPGSVVFDASGALSYIAFAGGVGPVFPVINGTLVGTTLVLISESPQVHSVAGRDVAIVYTIDGVNLIAAFVGPESVLAGGYSLTVSGVPTKVFARYIYGELDCLSGEARGDVPPPATFNRSFEFPFDASNQNQYGTLQSSGSNAQIMCTDLYTGGPWTFSFYVKLSAGATDVRIALLQFKTDLSYPLEIYYGVFSPNAISILGIGSIPAGYSFSTGSLATDQWVHIALVNTTGPLDWSGLTMYVDGVQVLPSSPAGAIPSSGVLPPPIGSRFYSFGTGLPPLGALSDYMRLAEIYTCNSARTQSDITNFLMTGNVDGNDAGWGRTLYLKPINSDAVGPDGVSAQNFNSILGQSDSYLFTGLFSTDSPI